MTYEENFHHDEKSNEISSATWQHHLTDFRSRIDVFLRCFSTTKHIILTFHNLFLILRFILSSSCVRSAAKIFYVYVVNHSHIQTAQHSSLFSVLLLFRTRHSTLPNINQTNDVWSICTSRESRRMLSSLVHSLGSCATFNIDRTVLQRGDRQTLFERANEGKNISKKQTKKRAENERITRVSDDHL